MTTPSSDPTGTSDTPPQVRPQSVPKSVPNDLRAPASQVRPRVPSSSKGTDLASPQPCPSPTNGTDGTDHPFITPRTRPFWQSVHAVLQDGNPHPINDLITLGEAHNLAERTVRNLVPRAARRGLLNRHHGRITLVDNALREMLAEVDRSPLAPRVSAVEQVEAMAARGEIMLCRQRAPLTEETASVVLEFVEHVRSKAGAR